MAVQGFAYWAFISYRHSDETAARRLHAALETYRLPKRLAGLPGPFGATPARLFPVFRDRDELAGASDLTAAIKNALEQSRALIVLCSRATPASRWVNEEIAYFRSIGRSDRIFAYLIDGEPDQAFPAELTSGGVEPLAADARRDGDGPHAALLKLVAGIAGVPFNALVARDAQRRMRRIRVAVAAAIASIVCIALTYIGLADASAPILGASQIRTYVDRYGVSVFRHVPSDAELRAQASQMRIEFARQLRLQGIKDSWYWGPGVHRDTWTASQAAAAVLRAPPLPRDMRRAFVSDIDASFAPHLLHRYGFWTATHAFTVAEPALWLSVAMADALGSPGLLSANERKQYLREIAAIQRTTDAYGPYKDGHWDTFPGQPDRDRNGYSTYASASALLALLEARTANLGWEGSIARRDRYARATARWLMQQCMVDRNDGVPPHCQPGPEAQDEDYPGLTLQVYAELLRSAAYGYITPTKHYDDAIAQQLQRAVSEAGNGQHSGYTDTHQYVDDSGRLSAFAGSQKIDYVVGPWALECATLYVLHLRAVHAPRDELAQYQRVVGDLLPLINATRVDPSPDLYPRTEAPYALAAVEGL